MRPTGTDDTVSVEAYPGDRLMVRAYAECARYPSGTPMGAYGTPELPSQQAPLRRLNGRAEPVFVGWSRVIGMPPWLRRGAGRSLCAGF